MAADAAAQDEPYTRVRCPSCSNALFRRYPDRLEMVVSPRGGQKRTIIVPLDSAAALRVQCEKCGLVSGGAAQSEH